MADTKISALSAASALTAGTEEIPVVQSATTVKATVQQLNTAITGSAVMRTATVTTSNPLLDLAQTWNAGAVTFTALKLAVTSTASAAASLLLDMTVGGTSVFSITKGGVLQGDANSTLTLSGGFMTWRSFGTSGFSVGSGGLSLGTAGTSAGILTLAHSSSGGTAVLRCDGADILVQRNSTAAQTFQILETFTDASNYSRFTIAASSTAHQLKAEAAGTGTERIIAIKAFPKAGAAVFGDIPSGYWGVVRDTSGATTKLVYNNAGTLMSVGLT